MRKTATLVLLLAAVCCTRPPSYETFVFREDAEYGDSYSFNLDFYDSLSTFSLKLFTSLERKAFKDFPGDSLDLRLNWISPRDSIFTSKTVLALGAPVDSSYFHKDYFCSLGEEIPVSEPGVWRLRVLVRNNPESLRGLGVVFKKNDD